MAELIKCPNCGVLQFNGVVCGACSLVVEQEPKYPIPGFSKKEEPAQVKEARRKAKAKAKTKKD